MDERPYVEKLSDNARKRYRTYAIVASCFGCFGELLQDSSAILMLYFLNLGASRTLTMFQTAFPGIISLFLLIPVSGIIAKSGIKKMIKLSCTIGVFSYLLMALSPYFGAYGKYWCALWCMTYCAARIIWSGSWFPMLMFFLLPKERAPFFGTLRFMYNVTIGIVFFLIGCFMDKDTPLWFLQLIILIAAACAWVRWMYMRRIKIPHTTEAVTYDLKKSLTTSLRNAPLVMFSVYVCFLMITSASIGPFTLLYLKDGLKCGDGLVQILSTVIIMGNVAGFFLFSKINKAIGMKKFQIILHFTFILIPLALAFCGNDVPGVILIVGTLLFFCNFFWAMSYAGISSEMLALGRPGNTTMASAFCQTYQQVGQAAGRTMAALLIGGNMLAATWNFNGWTVSRYQSIFLIFAVIALFSLVLIFCVPSVIPKHDEEYYKP